MSSSYLLDAAREIGRLHLMKLIWLVPPLKSLSLGQGHRLCQGEKLREEGFNFTGYKNWQSQGQQQTGEPMYMAKVVLIDPTEYLKLPSHLAEMARVDKFAALCGTTRDNPSGPPKDVVIDGVRVFVGAWARDAWLGLFETEPERWLEWMNTKDREVGFYKDGSIVRYSGGLRGGEYWNHNWKFDAIRGINYYDPKLYPRSSDDVEAILKNLSKGKIRNQPASVSPSIPEPPPVVQQENKPIIAAPSKPKPLAKLRSKPIVKRDSKVPIARIKKKR